MDLLSLQPTQDALLSDNGPIFRFYEHLTTPHGGVQTTSPRFEEGDLDFIAEKAFFSDIASYKNMAINTAMSQLSNIKNNTARVKLANLLNQYTQTVIQRTSQIGVGDISQIMTDLRKELKTQGKNLTVFIEDMTTFTGLDTELIKILTTANTGEYTDLCRYSGRLFREEYYIPPAFGRRQALSGADFGS